MSGHTHLERFGAGAFGVWSTQAPPASSAARPISRFAWLVLQAYPPYESLFVPADSSTPFSVATGEGRTRSKVVQVAENAALTSGRVGGVTMRRLRAGLGWAQRNGLFFALILLI